MPRHSWPKPRRRTSARRRKRARRQTSRPPKRWTPLRPTPRPPPIRPPHPPRRPNRGGEPRVFASSEQAPRERRTREPDPNSPFAKLAALKAQLEANEKEKR